MSGEKITADVIAYITARGRRRQLIEDDGASSITIGVSRLAVGPRGLYLSVSMSDSLVGGCTVDAVCSPTLDDMESLGQAILMMVKEDRATLARESEAKRLRGVV